jgi:hypothetical protein
LSHEVVVWNLRARLAAGEGRSALELGYTQGAEAASNADYKDVTRALVRYSTRSNQRSAWSVSARMEQGTYASPDVSTPEDLASWFADLGWQRDLGSPGSWRGRFVLALEYEMRDADLPSFDFDRLAVSAWLALVR